MNFEEQLQKIEDVRNKTLEVVAQLDDKLARKEIDGLQHQIMMHDKLLGRTQEEIMTYLDSEKQKIFNRIDRERQEEIARENSNNKRTATLAITAILLIACIGLLIFSQGELTGFVIKNFNTQNVAEITTSEYLEQTLEYSNITGLKISGTIDKGSANIKLRFEDGRELLLGEITATQTGETYTLTTDKKTYVLGEQVNITLTPNDDQTSTYVYHGEDSSIISDGTYLPQTIGEYKVVVVITDGANTERLELNFTVAESTTEETQEAVTTTLGAENIFTDICGEACAIEQTSNPTIIIEPINGATVIINDITTTTQRENNAPTQIKVLEDLEINISQERQIDLSEYFTDVDDETIFYDITENALILSNINGNILTITGQIAGEETTNIYATDSTEITTSNAFTIRVIPSLRAVTENTTNETNTTNEINSSETNTTIEIELNNTDTINTTLNESNITSLENISLCSGPINERPNVCFEGNDSKYFKDIIATLEDKDGITTGRFNRFGNFIIKGLLVEQSTDTEKDRDFKIIYRQQQDFEDIITTTAWIDTETGNLHLRGRLHEENANMQVPQFNTYIIKNNAGIVLAYFEETTGDLYLRGNLVQLGKVTQ